MEVPEGNDLGLVHRVYDANGRYHETIPVDLSDRSWVAASSGIEDGSDTTARRRIPVYGGAATVYSPNVPSGGVVQTLGETVRPDTDGAMVIQRILPAGDFDIDVAIRGAGEQQFSREIEITTSEWFYAGLADVTIGQRTTDTGTDTYQRGRLGFYVKGKTARGYQITASADTREDDLGDLLRNLDEKDPRSVLQRVDPQDLYPVYGDVGVGYNFGRFSDDLTDLSQNERGPFVNFVAK